MSVRAVLIVAATLMSASTLSAEPPKAPAHPQAHPQSRPAEVVLASADESANASPGVTEQNPAPAKRPRVARVTTCRCGDPQDPQDQ
jgi:hypothetical protein